jgi:hypothetical protein
VVSVEAEAKIGSELGSTSVAAGVSRRRSVEDTCVSLNEKNLYQTNQIVHNSYANSQCGSVTISSFNVVNGLEIDEFVEMIRAFDILGAEKSLFGLLSMKLQLKQVNEREFERKYEGRLPVIDQRIP